MATTFKEFFDFLDEQEELIGGKHSYKFNLEEWADLREFSDGDRLQFNICNYIGYGYLSTDEARLELDVEVIYGEGKSQTVYSIEGRAAEWALDLWINR